MSLDLVLLKLKELDAQNKAIIILLSEFKRTQTSISSLNARLRSSISRLKDTQIRQQIKIQTLQKENHELHGFLNEETKKVKFLK